MNANAKKTASMLMKQAESEGAKQEREMHELQQQYETPAYEGDNRKVRDFEQIDQAYSDAMGEVTNLLATGGKFTAIMRTAWLEYRDDSSKLIAFSRAIADETMGAPKKWFQSFADALIVENAAGNALSKASQ